MSVLGDGRVKNFRGGNGAEFWKSFRGVLLPGSAVEERRAKDEIYASPAHYIPNLVKLATDVLQRKVESNELDAFLPVTSAQWVRLKVFPSVEDIVAAS